MLIQLDLQDDDDGLEQAATNEYECRDQRNVLDMRTIEDIKKILTEDQRSALPTIGFRREIQLLKPQAVK
ncbi:MAG: hypothetical protein H7210_07820 [Pyrinomonadaceae bacterium]|nr:hypothetical protein [Phycisphaerales bacterium]